MQTFGCARYPRCIDMRAKSVARASIGPQDFVIDSHSTTTSNQAESRLTQGFRPILMSGRQILPRRIKDQAHKRFHDCPTTFSGAWNE
jgi:hypothetical protein